MEKKMQKKKKEVEEEREEGWPAVAHGVAGGGGGGRTQLLATVEVLAMTVLTVSSPILFLVFSFSSSFFFLFPLLVISSLSLFCSSLLSLYSSFLLSCFLLSLPLFLEAKTGEREVGAAIVLSSLQHVESFGQVGVVSVSFWKGVNVFLKGKAVENKRTKLSSSHVFCTSRGRIKATVPFKTASFWALFFF